MKHTLIISVLLITALLFTSSCKKKTDEEFAQLSIEHIEKAVKEGNFRSALDSISSLRHRFPKAIDARKKALKLWQEASLLQAQREVAKTDSLLQATLKAIEKAPTLLDQNLLRNKRDSLKARYDTECGLVRIIRAKQNGK